MHFKFSLVRSFLTRCLLLVTTWSTYGLVSIRERSSRSIPFIALFFDLPWLWLSTFEAHIAARIGGSSEADLIPGIGVSIVSIEHVLQDQHPEVLNRHLLPDLVSCRWITIVNAFEHAILFPLIKL